MSGSSESLRWNAGVRRPDLALYSPPKEFWGMESETILTPRGKSPLSEVQRWVKLAMLHHKGQSLTSNFSLRVAAHITNLKAEPSLRCTLHVAGTLTLNVLDHTRPH